MASGNRTTSRKKSGTRSRNAGSTSRQNNKVTRNDEPLDNSLVNEILMILIFAVCLFLFLCNFGIVGTIGDTLSSIQFGLFGLMAYLAPVLFFFAFAFGTINAGSSAARRKLIAGICLFFILAMICELWAGRIYGEEKLDFFSFYKNSAQFKNGGGLFAGMLTSLCYHKLSMAGTLLLVLVAGMICIVLLTEKSLIKGAKEKGRYLAEASRQDAIRRREEAASREEESLRLTRQERAERRKQEQQEKALEKKLKKEELEDEKILRMDRKSRGVMLDTSLADKDHSLKRSDDMHEITIQDMDSDLDMNMELPSNFDSGMQTQSDAEIINDATLASMPDPVTERSPRKGKATDYGEIGFESDIESKRNDTVRRPAPAPVKKTPPTKKYVFPPISLLKQAGKKVAGDSERDLKTTALRLQQTLQTFGVNVTITDISQGPSVTRYEIQPEVGVKVSKIVGLADDIKLNLAATDIRIEAPIPGKAAVGIEVPNKENATVVFRELLETKAYKDFPSNLAFAVGKDIGGQTVVTDIAKMPHVLIAGATGSGKSVCINTIIMSILYKAHPDDVKLIMIDPKVVELSVYNGIPHLLLPVVTDPKKAAGALHWGVAEMTERYNKFAEMNVRDLKGYNQKVQEMQKKGLPDVPVKMPQILIIVDELADLMMVAQNEVEESICRLAQLARAAGIHLVIATQRPSVDVITGLIKANMPSRIAFAVSSGVDSRTILDMNGAEKLLGKGDMLFYPQGYPKPARIQGAFISDDEVQDVVDFLKAQNVICEYNPDVEGQLKNGGSFSGSSSSGSYESASGVDEYFIEAGRFIIEKDKASIGMLQRVFKIGFNRAARIMDQLCEAGVVGEEEGTKPRKVLMSQEQFETYIEESL